MVVVVIISYDTRMPAATTIPQVHVLVFGQMRWLVVLHVEEGRTSSPLQLAFDFN